MLHLCAIINQPFLEQEIHTEYHTWHTYGFFCLEHLNNVEGKLSLSMCYLLNSNSSCFPAAAQQGRGRHKVSLVTAGSLSRLCHKRIFCENIPLSSSSEKCSSAPGISKIFFLACTSMRVPISKNLENIRHAKPKHL